MLLAALRWLVAEGDARGLGHIAVELRALRDALATLDEARVAPRHRFVVEHHGVLHVAPEAKLAREAEICYATIAMVTDYDSWHEEHGTVDVAKVIAVMKANSGNAKRLIARIARDFPRQHPPCPLGSDRALDFAIMTAPEKRDPGLVAKLDAVAGRVLKLLG